LYKSSERAWSAEHFGTIFSSSRKGRGHGRQRGGHKWALLIIPLVPLRCKISVFFSKTHIRSLQHMRGQRTRNILVSTGLSYLKGCRQGRQQRGHIRFFVHFQSSELYNFKEVEALKICLNQVLGHFTRYLMVANMSPGQGRTHGGGGEKHVQLNVSPHDFILF
jgi:hypothetical protein